jgi:SRSO17 transposase
MRKKGEHPVGVAGQYALALGKTANCQTSVSLTLACREVPVMIVLRPFLPESWTSDAARLKRAGVPVDYRTQRSKPEIALAEIDRAIAAGRALRLCAGRCRIRPQRAISHKGSRHAPQWWE